MTNDDLHALDLKPLTIPEGWLFAPTSFLTDRIIPAPERIWLPATETGGGPVTISAGHHTFAPPPQGRLRRLTGRKPEAISLADANPVLDLRHGHPQNWAHFLNIHLAVLALVSRTLDQAPTDFQILLPAQTPSFILKLADLIGLNVTCSDAKVTAYGVTVTFDDWNVIRGERFAHLTDPTHSPVMAALSDGRVSTKDLPDKVFLSRKTTRALKNEASVETHLTAAGYTKIYMEDLSVDQQIAVGFSATHVVAVHGAALAPFFYRPMDQPALRLIELFPVGHLTNVFRAMVAAQTGVWAGVRGHIQSQHLKEIYRSDGKPYFTHSLDPFSVDIASVNLALDIAGPNV